MAAFNGKEFTNDVLCGTSSGDTMRGYTGNDKIFGYGGPDEIEGGTGNDTLDGGRGEDTIYNDDGDDLIAGGLGRDILVLNAHRAPIRVDLMETGPQDTGQGLDTIRSIEYVYIYERDGTNGAWLRGGAGSEVLPGAWGNDTLTGGGGADAFQFRNGQDVVTDFGVTFDQLVYLGSVETCKQAVANAEVVDGNLVLSFSASDSVTLVGVDHLGRIDQWLSLEG
ncbi:calcium-binding protein [Paracoccus sp. M683]|uniref:calcium-binding protein n=1 Tax=Paracoccus sp. M683 TaxID=2594268 RepID=UPI001193EFEF|nr:calcium-binding protein [Paracoccus sp. M683]TRW95687.1 calcium-binding protein [Paracoccus sp. M683]